MRKYFDTVENSINGRPVAGAEVLVLNSAGQPAPLFFDDGINATVNPVATDLQGYYQFYIADGIYTIRISYQGEIQREITDVEIAQNSAANFAALAARVDAIEARIGEHIEIALSDITTTIIAGTLKGYWIAPYNFTLTELFTSLAVSPSSAGAVTVDANIGSSSILSTLPVIDVGETSSLTGTNAVIATTAIAKGQVVTFDIDTAGAGAKGLVAILIGRRT
jgi:hypothetical protein